MLSFLQSFAKKKTAVQPTMTRSYLIDSAMPTSTVGSSSKGDKDSTPATSMGDSASVAFDPAPQSSQRGEGPRSLRARRSNISSYNENVLSGSAKHGYRRTVVVSVSRAVSGETLVEGKSDTTTDFVQQSTLGLDQDWSLGSLPGDSLSLPQGSDEGAKKRRSTRLSVLDFASSVMEQTKSVLGKRGRGEISSRTDNTLSVKQASGSGVTVQSTESRDYEGPVSKRLRLESNVEDHSSILTTAHKRPAKRPVKKWLSQGLYVGQDPDFDPRFTTAKNKLKKANAQSDASKRRSLLPLPMFAGRRILETGRDFKLPFNVFSPLPAGQPKPDEWKKTHKIEYTGEIITQDECDERMENRYKDNEFDQGMILDATRGSIARFINHSCEPNCEMIKMTVAGKPRMALFASENGIMTGEELTYDYNFNPYSVKNVQQCRCGAPSCRGVLGPKPKEIKDALKQITAGGKRKIQQAFEDGLKTVSKKRKINVPSGIKKALDDAKIQTTDKLAKVRFGKADREEVLVKSPSKAPLRRGKSTSVLGKSQTKAIVTYSRRRSSPALTVKEEVEDTAEVKRKVEEEEGEGERPFSRRSSIKAAAHSVRKNVVRTVKRSGRSNVGGQRGKSIRVIQDA
ncbi:MAG: hypothetical protein Q9208_000713 [Pyrenodesmia sp. 3 TL-2023]